jgi:outer membrane receptor for ferric coprogen and ferric-rhodotorulic acid
VPTTLDDNGLPISSTAIFDRVEILRGASGLYNGLGGAGGTLNLVRKQPGKEYQINSAVGIGTNDSYLGQLDVTGPLNEAGTLRGRAVGSWQQIGRDNSSFDKNGTFYGILEGDLSSTTTAQLGASYEAGTGRPDSGFPAYNDGTWLRPSRSDYFDTKWSRYTTDRRTVFGNISHRFDNGWMTKFSATYIDTDSLSNVGYPSTPINASTGLISMKWQYTPIELQQQAYDLYAAGPFEFLGRRHELTIGANYQKRNASNQMHTNTPAVPYALDSIGPSTRPSPDSANYLYFVDSKKEDYGVYANLRFSISDSLTFVGGGRLSWYAAESATDSTLNGIKSYKNSAYKYDSKITPFAGIVYDLNDTYTAYASYATIFFPNTLQDRDGNILKPLEGDQYEIGVKGTYLDGRVNGSIALFRGTQKNRPVSDPDSTFYIAAGKTRAQGIDVSISGEVIPNLVVSAGYTYLTTKLLDDNKYGTAFGQYAPKHTFKLWADYKLPGRLNRWSVGGGVTAKSSAYNYNFAGTYRYNAGGYALVDGRIGYDWNKHTNISLNIGNIFNRYYISTIAENQYASNNYLGQGRSAMLTLRTSY